MSVLNTLMAEISSFYGMFIKYPEQCLCWLWLGSTDFDSPVMLAEHTHLQRSCKASDKCVYISSPQMPERKHVLKPYGQKVGQIKEDCNPQTFNRFIAYYYFYRYSAAFDSSVLRLCFTSCVCSVRIIWALYYFSRHGAACR